MQADVISTSTIVLWIVTALSSLGGALGLSVLKGIKSDVSKISTNVSTVTQTIADHVAEFKELKGFLKGKGYDL